MADCKCRVTEAPGSPELVRIAGSIQIVRCPMHKAASTMLAVLEAIEWGWAGSTSRECPSCHYREPRHAGGCQLAAAIAAAKGTGTTQDSETP